MRLSAPLRWLGKIATTTTRASLLEEQEMRGVRNVSAKPVWLSGVLDDHTPLENLQSAVLDRVADLP